MRSAWLQVGVEMVCGCSQARESEQIYVSSGLGLKQNFDTLYADKQKVRR